MIHGTINGDLYLIEMDDGKVNFLSHPLRVGLLDTLRQAQSDPAAKAVVLIGRGRCFCAGMNVHDLKTGTALSAPSLHNEILDCLAQMEKPVIAAIHGGAHGGGLELALGCHYRVATADAELSLPELTVGLMPGARGTQHLPRAIGLPAAADMILNGRRVRADAAPNGLIDRVVDGDLRQGAMVFARDVAQMRPIPHLHNRTVAPAKFDPHTVVDAGAPAYPGLEAVVRLLRASITESFDDAVAQEFAEFSALKDSEASLRFRQKFLDNLKAKKPAEPS